MNFIICGPPGSGKSSYVKKMARWGDLIVDTDEIYQAISGQPIYDKPESLLKLVFKVRDFLIENSAGLNVYLITGGARRDDRDRMIDLLGGATVVVLETSYHECYRRISNDPRRRQKAVQWGPLIKKWWDAYERADGDVIVYD